MNELIIFAVTRMQSIIIIFFLLSSLSRVFYPTHEPIIFEMLCIEVTGHIFSSRLQEFS